MVENLLVPSDRLHRKQKSSINTSPLAALSVVLVLLPAQTQAEVITFEDAPLQIYVAKGYKGYAWSGGFGMESWVLGATGDLFSARSGANYLWSNDGTSLTLSDDRFDFNSMWAFSGSRSGEMTVHGFRNGMEVYTQTFTLGPIYSELVLNFTNIDKITFNTNRLNLVMDGAIVNKTAAVPNGRAPLGMLGLALGGMAVVRRKVGAV